MFEFTTSLYLHKGEMTLTMRIAFIHGGITG